MCMDNWEPEITSRTFPLMKYYARKIGADFYHIDQRKNLNWPIGIERFQIWDLSKHYDWVIQLDADLIMHPDMPDLTEHITKDTILISQWDLSTKRFRTDEYFKRDGRYISVPGFFTITSNWCRDFWKTPDDLDAETAISNITPVTYEWKGRVVDSSHLLVDYIWSRNVAKFGLKVESFQNLFKKLNSQGHVIGGIEDFVCHNSHLPIHHKREHIKNVVEKYWKLEVGKYPLIER